MASIGALDSVQDFETALAALGDAAFAQLAEQANFKGLHHVSHFIEKVEILNRKYNTALNAPPPDESAEDPVAKEYRRQTQGY